MTNRTIAIYIAGIGILLALILAWYGRAFYLDRLRASATFDGERAYKDIQTQVAFGPRIPGSDAHAKTLDWIQRELESAGWQVEIQQSQSMGHPIQNLIASRGGQPPTYLLGAHYDTRIYADRDPDPSKQSLPTPGADNGASGVAVLLELARTLPPNSPPVWLVFFDAEDNGKIPGWDWLLGSKAFVSTMTVRPKAMLLVDMVGGINPTFYMDGSSDPGLRASIWDTAAALGYKQFFPPSVKYNIFDDHIPFIQAGIPSVDIIDIDYNFWLTTEDTPEHVAAKSLQIVGDVLSNWLRSQNR
jgi:glutaminyl-peptide cyclotransferase